MLRYPTALLRWDWPLQLNGQIREATRGIEDVRFDQRTGWARVETQGAVAALIEGRTIGVQRQTAEDFREEDP